MKTNLNIEGMHCHSCVKIIEMTLSEKSGVNSVSADYNSKTAVLDFDEEKTNIDEIKKSIEELGYKAQ